MPTILIGGGHSYVGQYLVEHLHQDTEVIAVSRSSDEYDRPNVRGIKHDLSEEWRFDAKPDVILYLANQHYLSSHSPSVDNFLNSNVIALRNALDFAVRVKCGMFVYFSSITALGNITDPVVMEHTPPNDPDFHGATKYFGERMVREYANDFPSVVLRLPGIIGPNLPSGRPWLKKTAEALIEGNDVNYYNGDSEFNNVCDVETIRLFIELLIKQGAYQPFDIINLAASLPMKMRDVVGLLHEALKSTSQLTEIKTDKTSFTIDVSHIATAYGFTPDATEAMLERFVPTLQHG